MFNIADHQRNVNQNHDEIPPPYTYYNGYYQKDKKKKKPVGKDVEKREPSYTVGGNVN